MAKTGAWRKVGGAWRKTVRKVPVVRFTVYRDGRRDVFAFHVCGTCGTSFCFCGSRECRDRCVWCDKPAR